MSDLRTVLLIAGVLILALVWLFEMRRERSARRQHTVLRQRTTPVFPDEGAQPTRDEHAVPDAEEFELPPMPPAGTGRRDTAAPAAPAEFVAIHVQAAPQSAFPLAAVFSAAESAGLEFGDRQIFHMPGAGSSAPPLFSMASMMEPGTFSRDAAARPTRGLTLFMRLPAETDAAMVLDLMLHTADLLATSLGGSILGMDRRPLTPERMAGLRQKVAAREG